MEYKPFVLLKLDKERKFRLSNLAFLYFEEISGKKATNLDLRTLSITEMNQFVFAGLKACDESITYTEVELILEEHGNLRYLGEKLVEAVESSSFLG